MHSSSPRPVTPAGRAATGVTGCGSGTAPWPCLSLGTLLAIAFGALVAISVGIVLAMSVRANFVNTSSLLNARAIDLIEGMERQMAAEAGQAERAVTALVSLHAEGALDRPQDTRLALLALLRTSPAVEGLLLHDRGRTSSMFRTGNGHYAELPLGASRQELERLAGNPGTEGSGWGIPLPVGGALFHNLTAALDREEGKGLAMALVGQDIVSRVMRQVAPAGDATVFLLSDQDEVVSHSGLPELFAGSGIMKLGDFPDPVLWQLRGGRESTGFRQAAESGISVFTSGDERHVFLTKTLAGYSARPLVLGAYFASAEMGSEMLRAFNSLLAGLGSLLASVVAAILLGRYISRPMAQIAVAASRFSQFRIDEIRPLARSRIREIDNQAQALNRVRTTLLQFTRYVPRQLVAGLMRTGEHFGKPEQREVTILFTDIIGFTGLAESMSAEQVAQLLNTHFELVAGKVGDTGGTIDKFMGDSAMAFWGAPERDEDHARNAVRAARAIAAAIRRDNADRKARGQPRLRVRMGIHSGTVVVGDIGSSDRQNYTVIGDAVNVAQRLEQLGREIVSPGEDVTILVSSDVVAATGEQAEFVPLGKQSMRGRREPVSVCRLQI